MNHFQLIVTSRINDHKAEEARKLAEHTERIRAEERATIDRQQAEQKRIAGLWVAAMVEAVTCTDNISFEDSAKQSTKNPTLGEVLHAAAPAEIANAIAPVNPAWKAVRDRVAACLDDLTVAELAIVETFVTSRAWASKTQRAA